MIPNPQIRLVSASPLHRTSTVFTPGTNPHHPQIPSEPNICYPNMDASQLPVAGTSDVANQAHLEQSQSLDTPAPASLGLAGPDEFTSTNGYSSDSRAHYSSHEFNSPARDFHNENDQPRQNFSPLTHQPQPLSSSRPSSEMSTSLPQPTHDVSQKQPSQSTKNSVVIKVGMVGDAQIGKTSLMVKYVEGSWDEDYIQTLGMQRILCAVRNK